MDRVTQAVMAFGLIALTIIVGTDKWTEKERQEKVTSFTTVNNKLDKIDKNLETLMKSLKVNPTGSPNPTGAAPSN